MINVSIGDETNINKRQLEMGQKLTTQDHLFCDLSSNLLIFFSFGGAVYITFYQVIDHLIIFKCSLNLRKRCFGSLRVPLKRMTVVA